MDRRFEICPSFGAYIKTEIAKCANVMKASEARPE